MPYEIRKEKNQYCVYNKDTGENKGCSDSHDKAVAHMQAMYAAESKKAQRYTQAECNYIPLSEVANKACANCRFFSGDGGGYCLICENYPLDILPTGYCNEYTALPSAVPASEQASEAAIEAVHEAIESAVEEAMGGGMDKAASEPETVVPVVIPDASEKPAKSAIERIKNWFMKPDESAFQVFKGSDGKHYWLARHTNNFEDRDQEILSAKAHEAYVARVNLGFVPPPELWAYHTKGTRHGQADQVWIHAGFVFALGHFDDTSEAQQAVKSYQARKGKIELSHGFTFPKWALKDGVYETYNTFEISTLPENAASNPYTAFEEIDTMALSEKQANWIKSTLGEAALKRVQDAQTTAEKDADVLKAIDAKYKDFVETEPTESDKGGSAEVTKTLLADMIAVNASVVEQLEAMKAERASEKDAAATKAKADTDAIAQLTATVNALKAQLDARPKSASTAEETKIDKSALPAEVTQANVTIDPFWRVPVKGE